ncbi:5'/3'-nucleotidase SurE, partial [Nonomuraea sp. RK-328]|nr:5'/3'-nucleotidase SurE [Nonomuraea sp. RK-328]
VLATVLGKEIHVFKRLALVPLLLLAFLTAGTAPAQALHRQPLRILLTNDDGYSSTYLHQLRQALQAAGHEVTVVAPAADSSASGTLINARFGGTLEAAKQDDGWAVGGSPSDAVSFGTRVPFAGNPPDLVVSGPNPGENVAAATTYSGTVGAAITAITAGVPAIAVSVARDGSAVPSAARSIQFTVRLVDRLAATANGGPVLPARTALNVNYPVTPNGTVSLARLGSSLPYAAGYTPAPEACALCYRIVPIADPGPDPVQDADRTLLAAGNVTITPMDGSWEAPTATATAIRSRLRALTP